jgi:hypothetical protein
MKAHCSGSHERAGKAAIREQVQPTEDFTIFDQ